MEKDKNGKWWHPAISIFMRVSAWVTAPIIVGLLAGRYLDAKYDTEPWILIGCAVLAFILSIFGIKKILAQYLKDISKDNLENKNGK